MNDETSTTITISQLTSFMCFLGNKKVGTALAVDDGVD
jgi:hypothetical protein